MRTFNVNGYETNSTNEVKNKIRNFIINEVETNKRKCYFGSLLSLNDNDWRVDSFITKKKGQENYHLVFGVYRHDYTLIDFSVDMDFGTLSGSNVNKLIGTVSNVFFKVIEQMFVECGVMTTDEKYFTMMVNGMTMNTINEVAAYVAEYYADQKNRCNVVEVKVDDDKLRFRIRQKGGNYTIELGRPNKDIFKGDDLIFDVRLGKYCRNLANIVEGMINYYIEEMNTPKLDNEDADVVKKDTPMLDKTIEVLKNAIDNPDDYYHDDDDDGITTLFVGYDEFGDDTITEKLIVDKDFWNEVFKSIVVANVEDMMAYDDGVYIDVITEEDDTPRLDDVIKEDLSMRNEIYEGIIDLVDRTYDSVLFDNDTKKLGIEWGDNGGFVITLYYKDKEDEWVKQECYDSDCFFENFSELFLGECNVIESMTNEIVNFIN